MPSLHQNLTAALRALAAKLAANGKSGPANHFSSTAVRLEGPIAPDAAREIATELSRSARIVELANFNREEERLFDGVYAEAKRTAADL